MLNDAVLEVRIKIKFCRFGIKYRMDNIFQFGSSIIKTNSNFKSEISSFAINNI